MDKFFAFAARSFFLKRWNTLVLCSLIFIFLFFVWTFISLFPQKDASLTEIVNSERIQNEEGEDAVPSYPAFLPELVASFILMGSLCYRFVLVDDKKSLKTLLAALKIGKE